MSGLGCNGSASLACDPLHTNTLKKKKEEKKMPLNKMGKYIGGKCPWRDDQEFDLRHALGVSKSWVWWQVRPTLSRALDAVQSQHLHPKRLSDASLEFPSLEHESHRLNK